ncbi:MAG: hypothetical protein ACOYN0_10270 [Phycisphaerales bacterium]
MNRAFLLCAASLLWLIGCRAPLPTYPSMGDREVLAAVAARQGQVSSVSAECELVLTTESGNSVHLDAAVVILPPGSARLRAWKLGHAVFDVTLVDGKVWVLSPEAGARGFDPAGIPARAVVDAARLLGPEFYAQAVPGERSGGTLVARGPAMGSDNVACEIDLRTLVVRAFRAQSDSGVRAGELLLSDYRLVNGIPWPHRATLAGVHGGVAARFHSVELNAEVPEDAFTPPSRAKPLEPAAP